jgi:hypothetical protein
MSPEEIRETLTDTDRAALERYLPAHGWEEEPVPTPLLKQWLHQTARARVQVPQDATLIDFGWLMERAVEQLARVEGRTAPQALEALRDAMTHDIVRVRIGGAAALPLESGVAAIDALPRLLQAAALATHRLSATYTSRPPNHIRSYLAALTLKQTEVGSFVLRLASPLEGPPEPTPPQTSLLSPTPLGRRVVAQLISSLEAAAHAAAQATQAQRLDPLEQAVSQGVSANLLEALSAFGDASQEGFSVEVDWSLAVEPPSLPRAVSFERAWLPKLREAAAAFRSPPEAPRHVRLVGLVYKLESPPDTEGERPRTGTIHVSTVLDGRPRKVQAVLSGPDYYLAAQAHRDEAFISLEGTLEPLGRAWALRAAHGVTLRPDDEELSDDER